MSAIGLELNGTLVSFGDSNALLIETSAPSVVVRLALITQDDEEQLLPESMLDDWGHEIRTTDLYAWIRDNGIRFPRAELFGFSPQGEPEQRFVRELDLLALHPCYVYANFQAPLSSGILIEAILLPTAEPGIKRIKPPERVKGTLRWARVSWWQMPSSQTTELTHGRFDG